MKITKIIVTYLTLAAFIAFNIGCFKASPIQLDNENRESIEVLKYVTVDGKIIDCESDVNGYAEIKDGNIIRVMSNDSTQIISLSVVKEVHTKKFSFTRTIILVATIAVAGAGIYAFLIWNALNDPRR